MNPVLNALRAHESRTALISAGASLTYQELDEWSQSLAAELVRRGARAGDRVGLFAPASLEYAAGLIAIWKCGALAVPLQPAHPESELNYIVADAGIEFILHHSSLAGEASRFLAGQDPPGRGAVLIRRDSPAQLFRPVEVSSDHGALMIYTSGTTRRPKGVVTTVGGLAAQIESLIQAWRWSANDRTLDILPLHHVHGVVNVLCCSLAAGACCELMAKFDAAEVWRKMETLTVFMAVPTVYAKLLDEIKTKTGDEQKRLSAAAHHLRLMVSGSAALPAPLFAQWQQLTGHRLLERYGMTEIGMALSNPYESAKRKPGHVGYPLPGVEVRLMGEDGAWLEGAFAPGEIQVKGKGVFKGYWRLSDVTAESFTSDGWFKTGDLAERDAEGSYRILGRLSQDIIKSGGYKISALEIESALLDHPSVQEVAVVGLVDEKWGERVAVAYQLRSGSVVRESELAEFLKSRLAPYKVPSRWAQVQGLPRNAMGKVLKAAVRDLFPKKE